MKRNIRTALFIVSVIGALVGCTSYPSEKYYWANNVFEKEKLVQKYGVSNVDGWNSNTILVRAAATGNFEEVRMLLRYGADANILDGYWNGGTYYDKTPLIAAAENGHLNIVVYLLQNGANINLRNKAGATAMSRAYARGQVEIYNYLKAQGAIEFEPLQSSNSSTSVSPTIIINDSSATSQKTQKTYSVIIYYELITPNGNISMTHPIQVQANSSIEAQAQAEIMWRNGFSSNRNAKFIRSHISGSW